MVIHVRQNDPTNPAMQVWYSAPGSTKELQTTQGWGRWRWREYDESRAKEGVSRFKVLGQVGRGGGGVGVVGVSSPRGEAWADRNSSVWAPAGSEADVELVSPPALCIVL